MSKKSSGFTVVEIIFVVIIVGFASILFFVQKNNLKIVANDNIKKTTVNAIYYNLEEVFYPSNKYYPQTISADNLKSVDPDLLKDTSYDYKPTNCTDNQCASYTLKISLQKEADYTKTSRNQ